MLSVRSGLTIATITAGLFSGLSAQSECDIAGDYGPLPMTACADGSPGSCAAQSLELVGNYSAGALGLITSGIDIYRSTDANSCPTGWKLFAPASQEDWATVSASMAGMGLSMASLSAPHFIVDVTRPSNGCGGCTSSPMNSDSPAQSSWGTTDGADWWLRSTNFGEPNGDYTANCYMYVYDYTPTNVRFNDSYCNYHSTTYLCQPAQD
jgi:hypothetical protein